MPEQQVAGTPNQPQDQANVSGTRAAAEGQAQSTAQGQQDQGQVAQSVDEILTKDPSQLTPEEIAVVQKQYKNLQGDYTKKAQELADTRKQPTNYAEMVQSPEFLEWAKQMGLVGQQVEQQQTPEEPEFMQSLTDDQKKAFAYIAQKQMQPYVQSYTSQSIAQQDEKLKGQFGEVFTPDFQKRMNTLQQDIIKNKGAMFRDELFKVLDYDSAIKRSFEQGRQEGLKGIQARQNANLPQGVTSPQSVTEQIYSDTDTPQDKLRKSFEAAEKKIGKPVEEVIGR